MFLLDHPGYLSTMLVSCGLLACLVAWHAMRRRRVLRGYAVFAERCRSPSGEIVRSLLLLAAFAIAAIIAMVLRYEHEEAKPVYEGLEIVAAIDCSHSMLAPVGGDEWVSRLSVVKEAVDHSMQKLRLDQWGLVCFSGKLRAMEPLTSDYARFLKPKLEDMTDPEYIQLIGKGTNFGAAIDGCRKVWRLDKKTKKICVILSDGEPQGNEQKNQAALEEAVRVMKSEIRSRGLNTAFYLIGVGDPTTGFKIPTYDSLGNPTGFLQCGEDAEHTEPCMTRPDPMFLEHMAETFEGTYRHLKKGEHLDELLSDILNAERRVTGKKKELVQSDLALPLFVLMIFFLLAFQFFPKRWRDLQRLVQKNK